MPSSFREAGHASVAKARRSLCLLLAALLPGCGDGSAPDAVTRPVAGAPEAPKDETSKEYRWQLPAGFPAPYVPDDNPMSEAKVELGRRLFYDERLSVNGTQSCGSCHAQERAFTDGKPAPQGAPA